LGLGIVKSPSSSTGEFSVGQEQLSSISRDRDATALQENGGVIVLRIIFLNLNCID